MKEFWTTVMAEVEVSNLGGLRVNMQKLAEDAGHADGINFPVKASEKPIKVKVKVKQYKGRYNNASKKKKIICLNTNQVFESLKAASAYYEISASSLSNCLKGHMELAGGYRWAYYTEQQGG